MRLFPLLFFFCVCLVKSAPVFAPPLDQLTSQIPVLNQLQKRLDSFQKSLDELKGNSTEHVKNALNPLAEPVQKKTPFVKTALTFVAQEASKVGRRIYQQFLIFQDGLYDLMQGNFKLRADFIRHALIKFSIATFLGALLGLILAWVLKKRFPLKKRIRESDKTADNVWLQVRYWFFYIGIALLPVVLFSVVQVSTFFLLDKTAELRNIVLFFIASLWIWVSIWRLQIVLWTLTTKFFFLKGITLKTKTKITKYAQILLGFWLADDWLKEVALTFTVETEMMQFISSLLGLGMFISGSILFMLLKKPILKLLAGYTRNHFGLLISLWSIIWTLSPSLFYGLFLIDPLRFKVWSGPLALTLVALPLVPLLNYFLNSLRVRYLWRLRHRRAAHSLFYQSLKKRSRSERLFWLVSYATVFCLTMGVWELNLLEWLKQNFGSTLFEQVEDTLLFFVGTWFLIYLGDRILIYYLKPHIAMQADASNTYLTARLKTLLSISRTFLRIFLIFSFCLITLARWGQDLTFVFGAFALLSLGIGAAFQPFVKDFFAGLFVLLDNSLLIGDWVDIDGKIGTVEELGLRTLRLRDDRGTLITIPYGGIKIIGNRNRSFSCAIINIPVPYTVNPLDIQKLLEKAYAQLKKMPQYRKLLVAPLEVRGIEEVKSYALVFQVKLRVSPTKQEMVRRAYNRCVKEILDGEGIRIPPPFLEMNHDNSTDSLFKK